MRTKLLPECKPLEKASLLFVLLIQFSSALGQLTLEDCQEKARLNYPLIKQYDLIEKSTEYTISNANKAYLPQVSLTGIGAYIISGLPSVSLPGAAPVEDSRVKFIGLGQLNQTIWDGGATKAVKNTAEASADVEKSNLDVSFRSIRERVNQLFFGILVIDEQSHNLENAYQTLERNLNKITLSRDNGIAYQSDIDEVKAEILRLDQQKIEFRYARKGYVEMLSHLIGQPLAENAELKKPEMAEGVTALENKRAELMLYANQSKLIQAQSAMNTVSNMPKVGLMGAGLFIAPGAQFATSQISSIAFAGLSVSWNTSNIYKSNNNRELNKIQLNRVSNQLATFQFTNKLELTQSGNEIEKQRTILAKDDEIVELKAGIRKSYQLKYDNGLSSMNDLINSIQKEQEAMSNRGLHQVQLLMSVASYKLSTGN